MPRTPLWMQLLALPLNFSYAISSWYAHEIYNHEGGEPVWTIYVYIPCKKALKTEKNRKIWYPIFNIALEKLDRRDLEWGKGRYMCTTEVQMDNHWKKKCGIKNDSCWDEYLARPAGGFCQSGENLSRKMVFSQVW